MQKTCVGGGVEHTPLIHAPALAFDEESLSVAYDIDKISYPLLPVPVPVPVPAHPPGAWRFVSNMNNSYQASRNRILVLLPRATRQNKPGSGTFCTKKKLQVVLKETSHHDPRQWTESSSHQLVSPTCSSNFVLHSVP